ncbi:hypothetical protein [Bradyrhizobium japonicum]|uniref:hypothetical protein n=1 Tax=Bradyrhizobium japonicum TaxID=375 RepID=UPI000551D0ED|nr:hypothetical protein [Bradyrhizobium japonicum]
MKEIAARNPERIFGREKSLPVHEIVRFSSIEELKEHLINDEIDRTQRDSFDEQVGWIISKADMEDFRPKYEDWPRLLELFERRNLFVHANGIVNDTYLRASVRNKFPDAKDRALGDELHAGSRYYNSSVQHVIHFGAMLLHVVWRKSAPDENERADRAIGDLGYELIARGQYELAIKILEFARNLRNVSSERRRRMFVVNLANAHKLAKNEAAAIKVLAAEDWTAAGNEFKVCVAAVKESVDDVVELMGRIGDRGEVDAQDYQEWPVFYGVRDDPKFVDAFKSIFGFDYVPSAKKQAGLAQVMDWIKEQDSENAEIAEGLHTLQSMQILNG